MRKNLRPEDLGDFLEQPKCATLATHFKDGTILMSPVWHEWQDGGFTVAVASEDIKTHHIRRDAKVSISVADDSAPYRGIEVRGEASIERANAFETTRRIAVRYLGAKQGAAYVEAFREADLVLLRVKPGVLRAWDFADERALSREPQAD